MGAALVRKFTSIVDCDDVLGLRYFTWIYDMTSEYVRNSTGKEYWNLYKKLDSIQFLCAMPLDENRAADGIDLRDHFGYTHHMGPGLFRGLSYSRPCSVLEMMAALAYRCEVSIMQDPDYGDRTSFWFYEMLSSLGVLKFNDDVYDDDADEEIEDIINIFMRREYSFNGRGGLFTIEKPDCDIRGVEIWYQMNMHLNEIIEKE